MRFGVREICDVVLKAKTAQKIGNKLFYKNEPVLYFDTLKTSSMEGAATTVYAQGGRGNARLMAWEGERTVTFTMEDALLSPQSFMILSGAGLIEATDGAPVYQHVTEITDATKLENGALKIELSDIAYLPEVVTEDYIYVMLYDGNEAVTEPYIASTSEIVDGVCVVTVPAKRTITVDGKVQEGENDMSVFSNGCSVLVDYYVEKKSGAQQIDISADKFGGNYYLEASTLFRTPDGVDMPAEFIIPNCKIQSNFTFTMANSGDPSTFTFTMDAFPDYTRFNKTQKVLAAIQIIETAGTVELVRDKTKSGQQAFFEV